MREGVAREAVPR